MSIIMTNGEPTQRPPLKEAPYWYCAFYAPDGRRLFRSTKETDRKMAWKIALAWEEAVPQKLVERN